MSILIGNDTRLLGQGITGNQGLFHAQKMLDYGTNLVAGITPGKGGEWILNGKVPIFDSVKLAKVSNESSTFIFPSSATFGTSLDSNKGFSFMVSVAVFFSLRDFFFAVATTVSKDFVVSFSIGIDFAVDSTSSNF